MKTAELYIAEEYGSGHLAMVIAEQDEVSVIGLMQEYGNYLSTEVAKQALIDAASRVHARHDDDRFIQETILDTPIQTP